MASTEPTAEGSSIIERGVGPIQLVVIGFPPEADFRGEIARAIADLRGRGVVRLIDALFVRKDSSGKVTASVRESELTLHEREVLGTIVGGMLGLMVGGDAESEALGATEAAQAIANDAFGLGVGNLQEMLNDIPPGTAALMLLFEHQWALDLKRAVRGSGGTPIIQGFVTPEALLMVGAELRMVVEAENTIREAQAIQAAAVLDTLATVVVAEEIQQAAVAETARVLMAAGLIEEAAAQDVIDTLVAADLIKQAALAEAKDAVEASSANGATSASDPPTETGRSE
jgi:uncharacterized membrane protein